MRQKSPQVVKHVVKGEKWACSTLKVGKNKPIRYKRLFLYNRNNGSFQIAERIQIVRG